jgi:hypothetical protein
MANAMPTDKEADPVGVVLLGPEAVMQVAQALAELVEQAAGGKTGLSFLVFSLPLYMCAV